jgi:phage minor structural protein
MVYDKTQREFGGMGLAVLEAAQNVKVRQVVNGEYTLSFVLPHTAEGRQYVREENIVLADGQAFRVRSFENVRDDVGKLVSNVQCEHISYDLNDVRHLPKMNDIINVTPKEVFVTGFSDGRTNYNGLLQGTPFTLECAVDGATDLFLYKTSPRAVLNQFLKDLGCEAVYDNWAVSLVSRRGNNNGVQFRLGKNLQSVKRKTDSAGLITRLYPYGDAYLDITSVNSGKAYIDSPLIGLYDYVHENYMDFDGVNVPSALKAKGIEQWSTEDRDGVDKPKVTYEVSVLELKKLSEYAAFEGFSLGDTVRVIDEALGIDVNARILEYDYYPYEPLKSSVVLANFKENAGGVFAELLKTQKLVSQLVTRKGQINDAFIESVQRTMQMKFSAAMTKKTVIHDYADVWVDDADNPAAAIALVDGMFALANAKKPDGSWNWRTIGSGGRLVADEVVSSWVYAGVIDASQINAGTINTNRIKLKSNDGRLEIAGNKITMTANNAANTALTMDPADGVRYTHSYDALGRPLKTTAFDVSGAGILYYEYDTSNPNEEGTASYCQYLNAVYMDQIGGGTSDPQTFNIPIYGPVWADSDRTPKVMVTPDETLRFVRADGGHVNDLSQYRCGVTSVTRDSQGIVVRVESWKTYVYSISGGSPTYRTGSLKFNILVILA